MAEEITYRCADRRLICPIPEVFDPDLAIALPCSRIERFANIVHAHPQFTNDATALNVNNCDAFTWTDNKGITVVGGSWVISERPLSLARQIVLFCTFRVTN